MDLQDVQAPTNFFERCVSADQAGISRAVAFEGGVLANRAFVGAT